MKRNDATRIISYLNAGFPREVLEGPSFAVWRADLELLADAEVGVEVAKRWVRNNDLMPTIHQFRLGYRQVAEQRQPRQIEEAPPKRGRERPEWVNVFCWARSEGETRWFPQQRDEGDLTREMMPQRDYELLLAGWVAAGSPWVASPQALRALEPQDAA